MIQNNQIPTEQTVYHYNIDTQTVDKDIDDGTFIIAEYVSNSSSVLVGDSVNCIDLAVSRTINSNLTGNSIIGVFDSSGIVTTTFATVDVTTFQDTEEPVFYTYCFSDYTIQTGDRIGMRYDLATEDDTIKMFFLDGSFDSDVTRAQSFGIIWEEEGQAEDLTMRLYDIGSGNSDADTINTLFIAFILLLVVLVIIMLVRALFNE